MQNADEQKNILVYSAGNESYLRSKRVEAHYQDEIREQQLPVKLKIALDGSYLVQLFQQWRPDIIALEAGIGVDSMNFRRKQSSFFPKYVEEVNIALKEACGPETPLPPIVALSAFANDTPAGQEYSREVLDGGACAVFPLHPKEPTLQEIIAAATKKR